MIEGKGAPALKKILLLAAFLGVWQACCLPSAAQSAAAVFVVEPAHRVVTLTGFTRPRTRLALVSEVPARCTQVYADVGDPIGEKGVFATLDTTFIRLELQANRADQQRLKSDVAYFDKETSRYRNLVGGKHAAQSQLDGIVRDLVTARQQLERLRIDEMTLAERLRRHTISAPSGWRVIERSVEPGEWVTQGQKLAVIGDFDTLLVPLALSVREFEALKAMERIELTLPDSGTRISAVVERVSPDFDPATRKINVDLQVTGETGVLRGGIRTELALRMPDEGGAVAVPQSALTRAYEDWFLVRPDGERVRVLVLGPGEQAGTMRVRSAQVHAGDVFLVTPEAG
ncbi:efflux transporter, RND family, MFP subunit [Oleidesulfovibrio alaskensis G20]|jgi:RND family efflux transporter MFP subunit|uniref:Efflux transporter, RND family, MFP subunit n=1 Tax=Oleidesulfovibrio alaskensis (strain ATCC BAA-1058 / DSM 17464 / G20) TaxID=207559 RepID=Q311N7_OLEA2|nr:efflux RND transporter periplasmic adaptor subunit [Oleidesulfovibrio alaskensis]ABB38359.1 efflux transporter, RND family, MFP subunit [Oleidesulfovibrio alaskensis G20]MBG0773382.1 efflux RND transporter periplasmic adaptor subunit [Oleidesulfovibrio alaskensis]